MIRNLQWLNAAGIAKVFAVFYVSVSLLYTTNFVLVGSLKLVSRSVPGDLSATLNAIGGFLSSWVAEPAISASAEGGSYTHDSFSSHKPMDVIYWDTPSPNILRAGSRSIRNDLSTSMDANLFLSKALALSEEHLTFGDRSNLEVIPFYYRGSHIPEQDDITITTLVTRNRFAVFHQLVEKYRGPISVTVHVSKAELQDRSQDNFLHALHRLYTSTPFMSLYVDLHLVLTPSPTDRQFNAWRNIARMFARTDYVMMLDVDFVPCTDFRRRLRESASDEVRALMRSGDAALVIPAFEYVKHDDGKDASKFPKDKEVRTSFR